MNNISSRGMLWLIVGLGVLLGGWFTVSPGTFFVVGLSFLISCWIWHVADPKERKILLTVFIIGLSFRYIFIVYYYYFYLAPGAFPYLAPDGENLLQRGWYISRVLLGKDFTAIPSNEYVMKFNWTTTQAFQGKLPYWDQYQVGIYSYYLGILFVLFDYAPIASKFISSLFFMSACVIYYYIAKDIFGKYVAKVSYITLMLFPSMFIHSTTNLLAPLLIFFIAVILWSLLSLAERMHFVPSLLLFVSLVCIYFLKKPVFPIVLLVIIVSVFLNLRVRLVKKIVLIFTLVVCVVFHPALREKLTGSNFSVKRLMRSHNSYSMLKSTSYRIYPERFYDIGDGRKVSGHPITPRELLLALKKGLVYFLFSPFPFLGSFKTFGIASSLQNLVWYFLFPFSLLGLIFGLRNHLKKVIPLFVLLFVFTFILSLAEGNTATAFRHRDFIMPVFVICAVTGLMVVFNKRMLVCLNTKSKGDYVEKN